MKENAKVSIEKYLQQQARTFIELSKKTHSKPRRKNVHQLRVTVRRIRAALWLSRHGSPHLSFGKLPASLRKLGQVLGKRRELDVALRDASKYRLPLKKLKSRRKEMDQDILKQLRSKHRKKMSSQLDRAIGKLSRHPEINLRPGIIRLHARLEPWVRKNAIQDKELHLLRIDAKKTRYALEAIGTGYQPLQKLQSLLGRGHDLQVLEERVGENKTVHSDMLRQYQRAKRTIKPVLQYAIKQLETRQ